MELSVDTIFAERRRLVTYEPRPLSEAESASAVKGGELPIVNRKEKMKRISLLLMVVLALVAVPAMSALAGGGNDGDDCPGDITVPITTIAHGTPGSSQLLASVDVPDDLVGMNASVAAVAENQNSVHLGNDLIVASDGTSVVLADVERSPGAVTEADGTLTLGQEVTVTLTFGEDGVFSAGVTVTLTCQPDTFELPVLSMEGACLDELSGWYVTVTATSAIDKIAVVDDLGNSLDELAGSYAENEVRTVFASTAETTGNLILLYGSEPIQEATAPPGENCSEPPPPPQIEVAGKAACEGGADIVVFIYPDLPEEQWPSHALRIYVGEDDFILEGITALGMAFGPFPFDGDTVTIRVDLIGDNEANVVASDFVRVQRPKDCGGTTTVPTTVPPTPPVQQGDGGNQGPASGFPLGLALLYLGLPAMVVTAGAIKRLLASRASS